MQHLQETIPGFKQEQPGHQWALARMAWVGQSKRRQHTYFEGHMSFSQQELARDFGRGKFAGINQRLDFFSYTSNWSMARGWTKGYVFSDKVMQIREKYMARRWRSVTRLLMANQKALEKLPAAVASRDMRDIPTTAWRNAKELNRVRVNIDLLEKLRRWLECLRTDYREGRTPSDLVTQVPKLEVIQRLIDITAQLLRLAKTDVAGHGYIAHHYVQAQSGRLYAKNINLQTAPVLVKQAALAGLWEYDFSNCHYSILMQMAARFGHQCQAITYYLANKKAVRSVVASHAGITIDQAKVCLLAIMYGARASEWHESAIPEEIGAEAAARLYKLPQFSAIQRDIQQARQVILKGWPRTANGSLSNAFGKAISSNEKAERRLAHLIQGAEAKALKVCIDLYPDNIVLLQHDGFAATTRLDVQAIEKAVFDATGYRLELEEELIQPDPDAQFSKYRIQNEIGRKPNAGAGFNLPHAS